MSDTVKLQMSEGDIVRHYLQAKNQAADIQVLADLNATTKEVIREVLARNGVVLEDKASARKFENLTAEEKYVLIEQLYAEGQPDRVVADSAGVSVQTVYSWRRRNGLKANYAAKKTDASEDGAAAPGKTLDQASPEVKAPAPDKPLDKAAPEDRAPAKEVKKIVERMSPTPDVYQRVELVLELVGPEDSEKVRHAARQLVAELLGAYISSRLEGD